MRPEQQLQEQEHPDGTATSPETDGDGLSLLAGISREMVRLFKEQFGRGPTSARANWAGPDTLTVLLEDTLTPAERNLAKMGEHQRLRDTRLFFQYASVATFCKPIERLTGRKVKYFFSSTDTEMGGASMEVFVLHPRGWEGPSRSTPPSRREPGLEPGL